MSDSLNVRQRPLTQRVINILWPSFLVAGVANILLFTWIDPELVVMCLYDAPVVSRMEAYSLGFFTLWLLTALASALTCYFSRTGER